MFQKTKYFTVVCAALLLTSPLIGENPRGSLHINGGFSMVLKENIDSGFKTGFGFSSPLLKNTWITLDFGYWKSNVHEVPGELYSGTLSMAPFQVSICYNLLETKQLTPYVFGGTGIIFAHLKIEDSITIPEVSIDQEVNDGISFHAGVGSLLRINKDISLFGEACFLYRKGEGITTITDMNTGESTENFPLNLNSLVFSIGIKYYL